MKRLIFVLLLVSMMLLGCGVGDMQTQTESVTEIQTTTPAESLPPETTAQEAETEDWFSPLYMEEQLRFHCLLENDGSETVTVQELRVMDYQNGKTVDSVCYTGEELKQLRFLEEPDLVLEPYDGEIFYLFETAETVDFDRRVCEFTLLDEQGREREQVFRFTMTEEEAAAVPFFPDEEVWEVPYLEGTDWCLVRTLSNQISQDLILEEVYTVSYVDGTPWLTGGYQKKDFARNRISDAAELEPGESRTWMSNGRLDSIPNQVREIYVYRDPQGQTHTQTIRFYLDKDDPSQELPRDGKDWQPARQQDGAWQFTFSVENESGKRLALESVNILSYYTYWASDPMDYKDQELSRLGLDGAVCEPGETFCWELCAPLNQTNADRALFTFVFWDDQADAYFYNFYCYFPNEQETAA